MGQFSLYLLAFVELLWISESGGGGGKEERKNSSGEWLPILGFSHVTNTVYYLKW